MELSYSWILTLNRKFIYVTYILYEYSLKVILNNIFHKHLYETKFHGMEFSNCGIGTQKVLDLENFRFVFIDLGIFNLYEVFILLK
jgi:hypothetical protein